MQYWVALWAIICHLWNNIILLQMEYGGHFMSPLNLHTPTPPSFFAETVYTQSISDESVSVDNQKDDDAVLDERVDPVGFVKGMYLVI